MYEEDPLILDKSFYSIYEMEDKQAEKFIGSSIDENNLSELNSNNYIISLNPYYTFLLGNKYTFIKIFEFYIEINNENVLWNRILIPGINETRFNCWIDSSKGNYKFKDLHIIIYNWLNKNNFSNLNLLYLEKILKERLNHNLIYFLWE